MESDDAVQTFRVTVRGRFDGLSTQARAYLESVQADHDIFKSGFTQEGTFTYDSKIDFFNLRYEVRVTGDDATANAASEALKRATTFLSTLRIGFRDLHATSMDMSAMWDRATRS